MNKEINYYIREFETIYDGEPWYGKSLMAVIRDIEPSIVFKKPSPSVHSVFEIIQHMYAWRNLLVKRLRGDTKSKISMNSADDWAPLPLEQNETAWKELTDKLEQNQQELLPALSQWKDAFLDQNFAGTEYTLRTFLNGHLQHDIYHIGQVALVMKYY